MDDKESKSPWDELAVELGAEPTAESFERKQTPLTEIPSVQTENSSDATEPPQGSPSDWNALAGSLGIEVEDEPAESIAETSSSPEEAAEPDTEVSSAKSASPEPPANEAEQQEADGFATGIFDSQVEEDQSADDPLPPLPSEVDQVMSETAWADDDDTEEEEAKDSGISGVEAKNAFDALFTASGSAWATPPAEPISKSPVEDRLDSSELDEEISEDLSEQSKSVDESDEEEKPRRRRPRRRRRGRGGRKPVEENATSGDEEKTADDDSDALSENVATTKDDEEEKPRRRRSRRRSRRSSSAGDPTTNEKKAVKNKEDDDLDDDLGALDDPDDEGQKQGSRSRSAHRNLPTWSDAIGGIVDSNLEQRSKSPSKPSSSRGRSRGGRRRGGSSKKS